MSGLPPAEKARVAAPAPLAVEGLHPLWLRSPWPLLSAACGGAVLVLLAFGNPLETMELRWLGQVLRWRYERGLAPGVDPHIVHLDISRHDLEALPTLEMEYRNVATLIRQATDLGARVVAFDAIFRRGTPEMARPILDEVARGRESQRAVVFAEALLPAADGVEAARIRSFPFAGRQAPFGTINVSPDRDGAFRYYRFAIPTSEGNTAFEPSLALASYLAWREVRWDTVTAAGPQTLRWEEISADFTSLEARELSVAPALLNFRSPWNGTGPAAFRHYTVAQLAELHKQSLSAAHKPLDNAIVLVSYVGAGLGDVGATSIATGQPRVHLHSTALNDLIQHSWLRRGSRWLDAMAMVGVMGLGITSLLCRRTLPLLMLWAGGLTLMALLSIALILKASLVVGFVASAVLWTGVTGVELARRYSSEFLERVKLRSTMSLYFSPRVMERVLKNPGSMEPQEAELTVLLTDLRNSTPIVECLGARGTFSLLNQVFEAQTHAIMAEDGSLEHFLGDQFLSYWGAPDPQPDAADRAFRAALALISAMENLRPTFTPRVQELFGYGVALHSGTALIGNKGSAQRLDYGLVGDLINAAARVESLTKHYGVLFLITRETFAKLSRPPEVRVIDEAIVKGKTVPLTLLEVRHPHSRPDFEQLVMEYNPAFEDYRAGAFAKAEKAFRRLGEEKQDQPSALMAERCRELLENPPAAWNGIYELKSK